MSSRCAASTCGPSAGLRRAAEQALWPAIGELGLHGPRDTHACWQEKEPVWRWWSLPGLEALLQDIAVSLLDLKLGGEGNISPPSAPAAVASLEERTVVDAGLAVGMVTSSPLR